MRWGRGLGGHDDCFACSFEFTSSAGDRHDARVAAAFRPRSVGAHSFLDIRQIGRTAMVSVMAGDGNGRAQLRTNTEAAEVMSRRNGRQAGPADKARNPGRTVSLVIPVRN